MNGRGPGASSHRPCARQTFNWIGGTEPRQRPRPRNPHQGRQQTQGVRPHRRVQPLITFNKENTYQWFRQNLVNVNEPKTGKPHDVTDRVEAFRLALPGTNPIPYGLFYKEEGKPTYDQLDPTLASGVNPSKNVRPRDISKLVEHMK